jgi:enoyl-CoA hydratase
MVSYERRGRVAVVTIERPAVRNAVDEATAVALGDAWDRFEADEDAHVGVLAGEGADFSAGADLEAMDLQDRPEGYLGFTRTRVDKPTVAAVQGHCVAGGLEMALWCDLRVADETAIFGCFERRFGVPLVDGATQRLPRIVGLGRALEMIETGRPVEAGEARDWGLVNRVVDEGDALDAAVDLAETIAGYPQQTLRTDRAAVYDGVGESLETGLRVEAWHGSRSLETARDGAERFADGEGRGGKGLTDEDIGGP